MSSLTTASVVLFICVVSACQKQTPLQTTHPCTKIEIHLAEKNPGRNLIEVTSSNSGRKIYLHEEVVITGRGIMRVNAVTYFNLLEEIPSGRPFYEVRVEFTKEAAQRLARVTAENRGKILALLVDGRVIADSVIHETIHDLIAIQDEKMTKEHSEELAKLLNAGCATSQAQ